MFLYSLSLGEVTNPPANTIDMSVPGAVNTIKALMALYLIQAPAPVGIQIDPNVLTAATQMSTTSDGKWGTFESDLWQFLMNLPTIDKPNVGWTERQGTYQPTVEGLCALIASAKSLNFGTGINFASDTRYQSRIQSQLYTWADQVCRPGGSGSVVPTTTNIRTIPTPPAPTPVTPPKTTAATAASGSGAGLAVVGLLVLGVVGLTFFWPKV